MLGRLLDRPIEALDGEMELATGLLGVLTRFSSYAAEVLTMQQQGHCAFASGTACGHLFGSLALTALGFKTWRCSGGGDRAGLIWVGCVG